MRFREIEEHDLKPCSAVYAHVFSSPPWRESWTITHAHNRLSHFFKSEGFLGLLAENERKECIGFVLGNSEPFLNGTWFYLREMCVDIHYQNQGVGSRLLNELTTMLVFYSVQNVYLATERSIPAAEFYVKNEFVHEDKMAFYYKHICT